MNRVPNPSPLFTTFISSYLVSCKSPLPLPSTRAPIIYYFYYFLFGTLRIKLPTRPHYLLLFITSYLVPCESSSEPDHIIYFFLLLPIWYPANQAPNPTPLFITFYYFLFGTLRIKLPTRPHYLLLFITSYLVPCESSSEPDHIIYFFLLLPIWYPADQAPNPTPLFITFYYFLFIIIYYYL